MSELQSGQQVSQWQFWAIMAQLTALNISNFDLKGITQELRVKVRNLEDFLSVNFKSFNKEQRK